MDFTINYTQQDVYEEVKRITDGRGVDVVFEHVGPATWEASVKCLARNGRLVTCGQTTGNEVSLQLRFLYSKQLQIIGSIMGTQDDFRKVLKLISEGRIKPVIDRAFPLQEAAQAQKLMEDRAQFGKIILHP